MLSRLFYMRLIAYALLLLHTTVHSAQSAEANKLPSNISKSAASQQEFDSNLCIIPVKSDVPLPGLWPTPFKSFPVSAEPFLYTMHGGALTVSETNVLEPVNGGFPGSGLFDKFVIETSSGRVIGINAQNLYVLNRGEKQFHLLAEPPSRRPQFGEIIGKTEFREIRTIAYIPRLNLTLIGTGNGLFKLEGNKISQMPGGSLSEVGRVDAIIDLPVHKAILLENGNVHHILLRHDNGATEPFLDLSGGLLGRDDSLNNALESQEPGRVLIEGNNAGVWEVEMATSASGFTAKRSQKLGSYLDFNIFKTSAGEVLILGRPSFLGQRGLERLTSKGVETIPNGDIRLNTHYHSNLFSIASRHLVLIAASNQLYAYDGHNVIPISHPHATDYDTAYDLPSINKVLVQTQEGFFELTSQLTLEKIEVPFNFFTWIMEMPASHVALFYEKENIYALDSSGSIKRIRGDTSDKWINSGIFLGIIPIRNVMLLHGLTSLHLIVDSRLSGTDCNAISSTQSSHISP